MKYPSVKFALSGGLVILAVLVFVLIGSCGKGKSASSLLAPQESVRGSPSVETETRKLPSLDEVLAQLDALEKPGEADPKAWVSVKAKLRRLLVEKYRQGKSVSKYVPGYDPEDPNHTSASKDYVKPRNLQWVADCNYTYGKLVWTYVNDGDYDQNSIVSISDLTPLAVHYGHTVGTDDYDEMIDEDDEPAPPPPTYNGDGIVDIDDDEPHNL